MKQEYSAVETMVAARRFFELCPEHGVKMTLAECWAWTRGAQREFRAVLAAQAKKSRAERVRKGMVARAVTECPAYWN